MRSFVRPLRRQPPSPPPVLSFGSWSEFPSADPSVVVVCHPRWRGVRTAAYATGCPVIECDDLDRWGSELIGAMEDAGVALVVVEAFPPGAADFLRRARIAGIDSRVVLHSSMAQHGGEAAEAAVADEVIRMAEAGVIGGVGFVKAGLAEAFAALGHPVSYVPNRAPSLPALSPQDLGPGIHIGVFAEPFWRKNVVTQLGAVALIPDAVAHVMRRPDVAYLDGLAIVEHGEVPWEAFLDLQASTTLNLYATLSECHPLSPIESYLSGVPALLSRTSSLFREDPTLWELTSVEVADDPSGIAAAAMALMGQRDDAVDRARRWIDAADTEAAERWAAFVG